METEAQDATTEQQPEGASVPEPADGVDLNVDPIDAALAGLTDAAPPEGEEQTDEAAKDKEKPEPPEGKRKRKDVEAELLSEQALATKDGVTKAADYVRRRQSKLDGIDVRLTSRAAELDERATAIDTAYKEAQGQLDRDRATARRLTAIVQRIDDPKDAGDLLAALGELRYGDAARGREVWDGMTQFVIKGGMRSAPPREVSHLEQRLELLQRSIEERDARDAQSAEQAEASRLEGEVKRLESEIVATASDPAKFPELARYTKLGLGENIVSEVARIKREARAAGRRVGNAAALAIIEGELKKLPAGATPASPAGARPASPAAASAVDVPITGIAPSQTRSAGSVREKTEAELAEDLANDPAYLSSVLGISL